MAPPLFGLRREDSVIVGLDRDETTIGRHTSNFFIINALPVSRFHSCIVRIDGRYFIKDRNTANGTYINKHKILPDREILLKIGDIIGIGCKPGETPKCTLEVVLIQIQGNESSPSEWDNQNYEESRNIVDSTTDNMNRKTGTSNHYPLEELSSSVEIEENKVSISGPIFDVNSSSEVSPSKNIRNHQYHEQIKESPSKLLSNSTDEKPFKFNSAFDSDTEDDDVKFFPENIIVSDEPTEEEIKFYPSSSNSKNGGIKISPQKNYETTLVDVDNPPRDKVLCIDLVESSEDEEEMKMDVKVPLIAAAEYSTTDDIIVLDSDDDDFPRSQLNTTNIDDVPDFSSIFQSIYNEDDLNNEDSSINLNCTQDTWFESLSQPSHHPSLRKLVVDLPMINYQTRPIESDEELPTIRRKKKKKDRVVLQNEQNKVQITSEDKSARSPKRSISEDDVDDSVKPSRKRISSDYSSSEHSSDAHSRIGLSETVDKDLQPCWVLLPSLDKNESDEVSAKNEKETLKAYSSPKKKMQLDEISKINSDRAKRQKKKSTKTLFDELDSKISWKEMRKERLKEIASKKKTIASSSKPEGTNRPVVVKITQKNRSARLIDSICKSDEESNIKPLNNIKSFHTFKGDELIPEIMRRREEEFHDSFLDDALDLASQNESGLADLNDEKANDETVVKFKQPFKRIAHKKSESSEAKSSHSKSKRKEHLSSEPKKRNEHSSKRNDVPNSESEKQNKHSSEKVAVSSSSFESKKQNEPSSEKARVSSSSASRKQKELSSEKSRASAVSSESRKKNGHSSKVSGKQSNSAITIDIFGFEQNENVENSLLESTKRLEINNNKSEHETKQKVEKSLSNNATDKLTKKKRVQFYEGIPDYNLFESNPEERRNNGIFAPRYKQNECIIKEELFEFEAAIAVACRWSVKWLEEQKMIVKPPPNLYKAATNIFENVALAAYKEKLREEMFLNLWRAIFSSYNKPEQDFLPHTQFVLQGDKNGLYTLTIDSVDASRTALLWTICALRDMDEYSVKDELINGQMVVLNFSVIRKDNRVPHKTMVFAYVASVNQIVASGGVYRQRIVLKIFQKDFEIVPGEIKIKVLTYTKTHLRPFQGLAMVTRSPLTSIFLNESTGPLSLPIIHSDENFTDAFLDPVQKQTINSCLNYISSPQPSISLVDGPPGCGKSQVIVSLLRELFSEKKRHQFPDDLKVLLITNSDNIADDLIYRLQRDANSSQVTLLRYGHSKSLHAKIKHCSLEDRIKNLIENDKNDSLINLEEEKRNLIAKRNSIQLVLQSSSATVEKKVEAKLKLDALEREYKDLTSSDSRIKFQLQGQAAKDQVIAKAGVIVTSVHSCWSSNFENDFVPSQYNKGDVHKFTVCIFDDANYVEEVQMLIPIMLMVRSLILVGDSKNMFRFREENRSPFLRLVRDYELKNSNALSKLIIQHRMQPAISKWFCEYYCSNFQPKQSPAKMTLSLVPMLVIYLKENIQKQYTIFEKWEKQVFFCCHLLKKIEEIEENDIPITVIVVTEKEKEFLKMSLTTFSSTHRVRVHTIEDICGRENEIVVVCLPVKKCDIDRWLYIACSRARSSLIVCGYFTNVQDNKSIQWMLASAEMKKICHRWDMNDPNFREDILRS